MKAKSPSTKTALCFVVAGLLANSVAVAQQYGDQPYGAWLGSDDDTTVKVSDSFNPTKKVSEDNDINVRKTHTEDYDLSYSNTEDNDVTKSWHKSEDNDITKSWQKSEDNDVDVDFQIANPYLTSNKHQAQDAGHEASNKVYGTAEGHKTLTKGGTTMVSAGNDETAFYGPAMVNNNTNQLPVNHVNVGGSNSAPIGLSNVFAGRDMGDKGVFAPIGNTSVGVSGDVRNSSGAGIDQTGDSRNSTVDSMSSGITR